MPDAPALEAPESPVAPALPDGSTETAPPEPKAPETGPGKAADPILGLLDRYLKGQTALTEAYGPQIQAAAQETERRAGVAAAESDRVLRPAIEGVKAAASVPVPQLPQMASEPPVPDRRAKPFLSSKDGESAVSALVTGLGLLGQLAMGGKAPVAALNALTGAMKGWAEGDATRSEREWKQYLQTVDRIRHENAQGLKLWEAAMQSSGTNLLQAEARYKAATAEAGLADKWAAVPAGSMGRLLEMLKYEQGVLDGVMNQSTKVMNMKLMDEHRKAVEANTAAYQRSQIEAQARRQDEIERRNLSTEDIKRDAAKDILKSLPASVRTELLGDREVGPIITAGGTPSADQIGAALQRVRAADLNRVRETGNLPKPTPIETMKRLEDLTIAQGYVSEMQKLAESKNVSLEKIVGGVRPWFNQIAQTGKIGPFPISDTAMATLTPDERRFLALTQDYADTILRIRSGAAINESEFKRMLQFIPDQSVTPSTMRDRLELQNDLLAMRKGTIMEYTEKGGYRAPDVKPRPVEKPKPPSGEATSMRVRRKSDGKPGLLKLGPGEKMPAEYELVK